MSAAIEIGTQNPDWAVCQRDSTEILKKQRCHFSYFLRISYFLVINLLILKNLSVNNR